MFIETATLILKHSDISTNRNDETASSYAGSWINGKQSTTWNINLRELIGYEIYDNNKIFCLRLNQLSYDVANFPNSVYDNGVIFKLSGLEFLNSTYSPKTGNNSRTYDMLLCNLTTTGGTFNYSPNISLCNFKKSQNNVNITIELNQMNSDQPARYGAVDKFPHMCYSFDIYAIKE